MSDNEILAILFPADLSIGQFEEIEETKEMLKSDTGRMALIEYIKGVKNAI